MLLDLWYHPVCRDFKVAGLMLLVLAACASCRSQPQETLLVGRPAGPYRLELALTPTPPHAQQETVLTYRVLDSATKAPVHDLQVLHERVVHTFIVSKDFRSFAHTHHEDFAPLTPQDLDTATFHFPYVFPHGGEYLIASEFTYKDHSWVKQFTVPVAGDPPLTTVAEDMRREKSFGAYQASLSLSPDPPVAGYETELVCHLMKDGAPVSDLKLYLGTEVHMASWRVDGEHFGHQHTYTPAMAAMMAMMKDHASDPEHMARMMVQLMRGPAQQVFYGPDLPVHHIFPAPGVYKVYFESAPGGTPLVADFQVKVVDYEEGMDTTIHSLLPPPVVSPGPAS